MREDVVRNCIDATGWRFKGEETSGRYNLTWHSPARFGDDATRQGTERRNMMTKSGTISEIMRINPTVNSAFLAEFAADQLSEYLDRLSRLSAPKVSPDTANLTRSTMRPHATVAAGAA